MYLMFGVAPVWVIGKRLLKGDRAGAKDFVKVLWRERRLAAFHFFLSLLMFLVGTASLRLMTRGEDAATPGLGVAAAAALILLVTGIFVVADRRLKRRRPGLFDDMDDSEHGRSWPGFLFGTVGVIGACWAMNEMFLAWTDIYGSSLGRLFGPLVFTALHYFLGSIITSLPEMIVAIMHYQKATSRDSRTVSELNTGLGSVTYSNFVNLVLGLIGILAWVALTAAGASLAW